jgi:hypothetical protein
MTSCSGGGGQGTQYTYAQLEGLWIAAGGSKALAPTMAAIAEAESGGCSSALNSIQACGLWQIHPYQAGCLDAATNAKMAVGKYQSQGLTAWATYTSGAYKAYVNGSTTPDTNVPGSSSDTLTSAQTAQCLFAAPSLDLYVTSVGGGCLISKTNARALLGGAIVVAGLGVSLVGVILIAAYGFGHSGAKSAAEKVTGTVLEVGGAAAALGGAPEAGAPIAAAGSGIKSRGKQASAKRQQAKESRVISHREMSQEQLAATRRRQTTKVVAGPAATASDRKAEARSRAARNEEPPF